jgi:GNAT-family acetyltransferase (TIGR03103 family)
MESTDLSSRADRRDPHERVGPGGDPIPAAPPAPVTPSARPEPAPAGTDPAPETVLECGWGRLVFGQTFHRPDDVGDVLRAEAAGARDIGIYLADPHVLVSRRPDELFIDPSLMYRLSLPATRLDPAETEPGAPRVRRLSGPGDAETVNAIYSCNNMLTAPVETLVKNAEMAEFIHLVAVEADGAVVGTVTGVDHVEAFGDPENGASLWCLTVDQRIAPPGTGQALIAALAEELTRRGRSYVDLSVLAENEGAIRFYERLGFERTTDLCVKRKNPINERLFRASPPDGYSELNPYARLIADEALRRGILVEVLDATWGEMRLTHGGRTVVTRESLSELTSAVAMSRCDDKRATRRVLAEAGLPIPRGRDADGADGDARFLAEAGSVVVKPARGEQGVGITVGVTSRPELEAAVARARQHCPDVLVEELRSGEDLRVVVIDHEVVAAAVRRPASIVGDGTHTVEDLIVRQSRRREAATGGESRIPLDGTTREVVRSAGRAMTEVLPRGERLTVRRTANLHTGGTIHDVTGHLHPDLVHACVTASQALAIPVTGLDLLVAAPDRPDHVFIEANERPGLANHEPQPTTERFVDLLFPGTSGFPRRWVPAGPAGVGGDNA